MNGLSILGIALIGLALCLLALAMSPRLEVEPELAEPAPPSPAPSRRVMPEPVRYATGRGQVWDAGAVLPQPARSAPPAPAPTRTLDIRATALLAAVCPDCNGRCCRGRRAR